MDKEPLVANLVTTSKAPVTSSVALVSDSFLLLLVRHLLVAMAFAPFIASDRSVRSKARSPVRSLVPSSDALGS